MWLNHGHRWVGFAVGASTAIAVQGRLRCMLLNDNVLNCLQGLATSQSAYARYLFCFE